MITQTYKLNIIPRAERAVRGMTPPTVNVSQYDKGLRTLVFDLYDGNNRLTLPSGQTAKIYGKKPDANVFEYDMTVTEDRQSVSIVLQEQMAVIAGCVECEVRIYDEDETAGSANFILAVEKAPVGAEEAYSESEIPEIDNLLYGGNVGDVFTKTDTGARWAEPGTGSGIMLKSEYDPDNDGSVLKADHADDADTVDGHTVARNVLADEYTNAQIDSMMQAAGTVKTVNNVQPDQNGNVQIAKADIGLGNVDNTSDANKPISTATQAALDLKVDKVSGKGLSTNDYTDADKTKLADLPTDAELTAELAGKVDTETGKGLSTNDFTDAEKTKLQGIETGAQVNTVTGVKGGNESVYRTGDVNITKANIGLENVNNTSDLNKPISTATQAALDQKVDKVTGKGLSTNDFTTAEKEKLTGIAAGAEVNVQANWNEADNTSDAYIQNKPDKVSDFTNDAGYITGVDWGDITGTLADQTDLNNELTALNAGLNSAVKSVNDITPYTNGNVEVSASDIPAKGMGAKETSGNPIEIEDGVAGNALDLSVDLEPIQDLHGYANPWPGGAGKNKLSDVKWYSFPYSPSVGTVLDVATTVPDWTDEGNGIYTITLGDWLRSGWLSDRLETGNTYVFNATVVSGSPRTSVCVLDSNYAVTRVTGNANPSLDNSRYSFSFTLENDECYIAFAIVGKGIKITVKEPQVEKTAFTSYAPYSNICPISGYDEVDILRTGKNLLNLERTEDVTTGNLDPTTPYTNINETKYLKGYAASGYRNSALVSDVLITETSVSVTGTAYYGVLFPVRVAEGSTYTISVGNITGNGRVVFNFMTSEGLVTGNYGIITANNSATVLVPTGASYIGITPQTSETGATCIINNIQIEKGTEVTSYEPYAGQSVTVQLGQTVYGGTLDVNTGKLVVTHAIVDLGTLNWIYGSSLFFSDIASRKLNTNLITSIYQYVGNQYDGGMRDGPDMAIGTSPTNTQIKVKNTQYSDGATFKTAMSGVQLCYELETPIETTLTPAQLALLEGYNIITSNADTINLRYIGTEASDVQAEIDEFENVTYKLTAGIAPIEQTTAIATHAVGDYIMLNGEFCKVISAIAVGETITIGTNVSRTTIADELKAIIAQLGA